MQQAIVSKISSTNSSICALNVVDSTPLEAVTVKQTFRKKEL